METSNVSFISSAAYMGPLASAIRNHPRLSPFFPPEARVPTSAGPIPVRTRSGSRSPGERSDANCCRFIELCGGCETAKSRMDQTFSETASHRGCTFIYANHETRTSGLRPWLAAELRFLSDLVVGDFFRSATFCVFLLSALWTPSALSALSVCGPCPQNTLMP